MIPLRATRYAFGVSIMVAHFATIAIYILYGSRRLEVDEVVQGAATVAPVAAVYLTTFLNYVTTFPQFAPDEEHGLVSRASFGVQYSIVLLFCVALMSTPFYIFSTGTVPYEHASLYTGVLDTIFGAYLGLIFKRLFPFKETTG